MESRWCGWSGIECRLRILGQDTIPDHVGGGYVSHFHGDGIDGGVSHGDMRGDKEVPFAVHGKAGVSCKEEKTGALVHLEED